MPPDHYKEVANAYALVPDRHRGPPSAGSRRSEALLLASPAAGRAARPAAACSRRAIRKYAASNQALCVVTNVYQGMEGVEPGEVKWLRINEALPRYWSTGRRWEPSLSSSSWKAALWPRVQWGVVPVEEDGSAHFVVPANRSIFFQALDENFRELQRERTYVNYAPGEVRSCTGCHGQSQPHGASGGSATPLALTPGAEHAPAAAVRSGARTAADGRAGPGHSLPHRHPADLRRQVRLVPRRERSGRRAAADRRSHRSSTTPPTRNLPARNWPVRSFPSSPRFSRATGATTTAPICRPGSLGCPTSTLIAVLTNSAHPKNAKDDHSKMLTAMELMILSRWVDTNYQFYGSYFGRQHPQWVKRGSRRSRLRSGRFPPQGDLRGSHGFLAPPWHR